MAGQGPAEVAAAPAVCLVQEVDGFSNFKTQKTGLGISGPGYVLLLQCAVLVMLTVATWQCLLPLGGRYCLEPVFAALAQCSGACLWCVYLHRHANSRKGQLGLWSRSWERTELCCIEQWCRYTLT